jgi:hypothetical protein
VRHSAAIATLIAPVEAPRGSAGPAIPGAAGRSSAGTTTRAAPSCYHPPTMSDSLLPGDAERLNADEIHRDLVGPARGA